MVAQPPKILCSSWRLETGLFQSKQSSSAESTYKLDFAGQRSPLLGTSCGVNVVGLAALLPLPSKTRLV
ncbi:hypothetical protein QQP08_023202 [Theobroma cacao]|nr:hypothetical protein QQP08_023202 [Theobroma cacao]